MNNKIKSKKAKPKLEGIDAWLGGNMAKKKTKKEMKQEKYEQSKKDLDFCLRHEIGLGTAQIKKLWQKLDVVFTGGAIECQ